MGIIRIPKHKPRLPEKESVYDRVMRESREKEAAEAVALIKKENEQKADDARVHKLILKHLDDLQDQIEEKNLLSFWTFPDQSGFKKVKGLTYDKMQKLIFSDTDKYKNRKICNISISFFHNDPDTHVFRKAGIYLNVSIDVIPIEADGTMSEKPWGGDMCWELDDFKTTKFSFKLIEIIYREVESKRKIFPSLLGISVTRIIKDLEKQGVDFEGVLKPLKGSV